MGKPAPNTPTSSFWRKIAKSNNMEVLARGMKFTEAKIKQIKKISMLKEPKPSAKILRRRETNRES